ncbi:unnamed protein product [Peronospora farinosa]|uniref:Uncharacterized protein n=1 Tax=Peronospora farinosa TaxID=134698 RepID=A0AAV0SSX7_9STRA|nr:unnamed protein product [Peronospora farinosa]
MGGAESAEMDAKQKKLAEISGKTTTNEKNVGSEGTLYTKAEKKARVTDFEAMSELTSSVNKTMKGPQEPETEPNNAASW